MDILKFITAGNVDDGKSTLIGRLLYDTGNIKQDVMISVSDAADAMNLAHVTDGLRSEREQGITIDIAYKYFTTSERKYIIIDAPGHFQYTKNLVTGASGADVMIILVDVRNGITEQTRRHSMVASFLKIAYVVIAINKMDAMSYDQHVYEAIKNEYEIIARQLQLDNLTFIPISALYGDNVISNSGNMPWYTGTTLMQYLESCTPVAPRQDISRLSVQTVIYSDRPGLEIGYAGKILSGNFQVGHSVVAIYPSTSDLIQTIRKMIRGNEEVMKAHTGENVCLYLYSNIDSPRGKIIGNLYTPPRFADELEILLCWLNADEPLKGGTEYILQINAQAMEFSVTVLMYKIDVHTFKEYNDSTEVHVNDFAKVRIKTKAPIIYDHYDILPENGRGIIIDKKTNYTSGAFVIR